MTSAQPPDAAPRLSVITPSFNYARFLTQTLDSVRDLQISHEHLVMDGGSDDGTVEILAARDDDSLAWVSEPDGGQTDAVNKGIERSRGEFLTWLNADDSHVSANVDEAVRIMVADPSIDAVFGFMDVVDEDGRFVSQYRCGPFSWARFLYAGPYLPTPTIIWRRSQLEQAPRLDERYKDSADFDFYLRLLRGAKVHRLRKSLVRFRYHAQSKTGGNIQLQEREALEIRLRRAHGPLGRAIVRALTSARALRERIRPSWPELPAER